MSFERKKTKKNRECYVLDLFDKVKKKTCLRRYWYTSEVFANTINKSFGLNDPIEVKELDRILKSASSNKGWESCLHENGVYIRARKTHNLNTLDGHKKNYLFIWCGNKNESPKNIEYWFDSITEFSFCNHCVKRTVDCNIKEVLKVSNEDPVLEKWLLGSYV